MRGGACVLTLHRVVARMTKDHDVSKGSFVRLLDALGELPVPARADLDAPGEPRVVLTFDDGTEDHAEVGELLAERGLSAVFFVPTSDVGRTGHLRESQVQRLGELGHAIGSHASDHRPLAGLTLDELRTQVSHSQDELQRVLGSPVRYFAPPGGVGHPLLPAVLHEFGFCSSRSMRWGIYRRDDNRWRIPCLPVTELTLRRGWIGAALADWELPFGMRAAWRAKAAMPRRAGVAVRHLLHTAGGRA